MIGRIAGIILHRAQDHVLIDVRGVGYIVHVSERTAASLPAAMSPSVRTANVSPARGSSMLKGSCCRGAVALRFFHARSSHGRNWGSVCSSSDRGMPSGVVMVRCP